MKTMSLVVVLVLVAAFAPPANAVQGVPCRNESRGVTVVQDTVGGFVLGTALGALIGGDRAAALKGGGAGAAAGAGAGIWAAKNLPPCDGVHGTQSDDRRPVGGSVPHDAPRIQTASERRGGEADNDRPALSRGESVDRDRPVSTGRREIVFIRNVYDRGVIDGAAELLERNGFSVSDTDNRRVDFRVDITVDQVSYSDVGGGDSGNYGGRAGIGVNGTRMTGVYVYNVSVKTIDRDDVRVPSMSGSVRGIRVNAYQQQSGGFGISYEGVGYNGTRHSSQYATNPQAVAALLGLEAFFQR